MYSIGAMASSIQLSTMIEPVESWMLRQMLKGGGGGC
jgi:hypothetical protein